MATYSNWREDLIEVIDTPTTEKKDDKKIKETKITNKVVINPTFKEAVAEMGGEIVEMAEVEDSKEKAKEAKADKDIKAKQKRVGLAKRMILQKKMQAVRAGAGADITAGYEPEGEMIESVMKMVKRVMSKKKPEKKAQKAMDAGAMARRKLQQKDHETVNFLPMNESDKPEKDITKINEKKRKNALQIQKVIGEDKGFDYVLAKLKAKHGDGVLTKRDKIKPQSAADKAKARAHQAKVDAENAAERKKDPSQGRYPKG